MAKIVALPQDLPVLNQALRDVDSLDSRVTALEAPTPTAGVYPVKLFTPSVSGGTGNITTATATARYRQIGKLIFIQIAATITTNGTGASWVYVSLPLTAANVAGADYVLTGRAVAISGKMLQGQILPNEARCAIFNYDNTYPAASGETLVLSGFYETN